MSLRISLQEAEAIQKRNGGQTLEKSKPVSKRSKLEQDIELQLRNIGAPEWVVEYKFHCIRDWRFDLAWPDLLFAVEVDGLIRSGQGGHQSIEGVTNDCQKVGEAMLWGWHVYRCTAPMIKSGEACATILRLLARRTTDKRAVPTMGNDARNQEY